MEFITNKSLLIAVIVYAFHAIAVICVPTLQFMFKTVALDLSDYPGNRLSLISGYLLDTTVVKMRTANKDLSSKRFFTGTTGEALHVNLKNEVFLFRC